MDDAEDRAAGALVGLALGDALGMPTQELTRDRAEALLGAGPVFLPGPPDNPVSAGLPAGSVTDDTEQALVLARLLVAGRGRLDVDAFADALLTWEDEMRARGSLDLLGPTTRRALAAIRAGADPATTGRGGTTNGAAMRVAPVGIAAPPHAGRLAAAVLAASRPTHGGREAMVGALAVAAVVSFGVAGAGFEDAWRDAVELADRSVPPADEPAADVAGLVVRAVARARAAASPAEALVVIADQVGTTLQTRESVPAAFAVAAMAPDDAWTAAWYGARLGGDADTIAAIAGAMVGACTGASRLPAAERETLAAVNGVDLPAIARDLLALRTAAA